MIEQGVVPDVDRFSSQVIGFLRQRYDKHTHGIMASLINPSEIRAGLRFASGIPRLLRQDISNDQARQVLERRPEDRRAEFLDLVRVTIYENPGSSYRALLEQAGCEFGDLRKLVEGEDDVQSLHPKPLDVLFKPGPMVRSIPDKLCGL